jgi:hypothetical protein
MAENKAGNGGKKPVFKDNGRGLPTTGTKTPMPSVKPPKPPASSNKK